MADKDLSYYDILGIEHDATPDVIKSAYRAAAKTAHPDHGGAQHLFRLVQQAYDTLSNESKKADYDKTLANSAARVTPPPAPTPTYTPTQPSATNWGAYKAPTAQHIDQELYRAARARQEALEKEQSAVRRRKNQRRLEWLYILLTGSMAPIAWCVLYFFGHVSNINISYSTWPVAGLLSLLMMWWMNKHEIWYGLGHVTQGWKRGLVLGCVMSLGYSTALTTSVVGAIVGVIVIPTVIGFSVWSTKRKGAVQWSVK